jgi:phage terminase large subunit-like protein
MVACFFRSVRHGSTITSGEITAFPGCRYDDQVDSTSQALEFLETKCRLTLYDLV